VGKALPLPRFYKGHIDRQKAVVEGYFYIKSLLIQQLGMVQKHLHLFLLYEKKWFIGKRS
jgi:hypothetical protein